MGLFDLTALLKSWPYDPENTIRLIQCEDGREVLQVRLPMGVEQYEMDGRPDGEQPHGMESALHYYLAKKERAERRGEAFSLSHEACVELINESTLYYYRYVHLFQIQDWARTDRDTARNLALFDFVRDYAEDPEDAASLEQWRPYILRMNAVARAMMAADQGRHLKAIDIVREAIDAIEALDEPDDENPTFRVERDRSLEVLRSLELDLGASRPLSEMEQLEKELQEAVAEEDYEHAAELRDLIRVLKAEGDE